MASMADVGAIPSPRSPRGASGSQSTAPGEWVWSHDPILVILWLISSIMKCLENLYLSLNMNQDIHVYFFLQELENVYLKTLMKMLL